jgi:hypothetical protein
MRAIGWCLKKLTFFTHIRNPRWPPMQDLIGKVNNSFFLEKTNMIEPKLYEIQDGHQHRTSSLTKFWLRNYRKMNKPLLFELKAWLVNHVCSLDGPLQMWNVLWIGNQRWPPPQYRIKAFSWMLKQYQW